MTYFSICSMYHIYQRWKFSLFQASLRSTDITNYCIKLLPILISLPPSPPPTMFFFSIHYSSHAYFNNYTFPLSILPTVGYLLSFFYRVSLHISFLLVRKIFKNDFFIFVLFCFFLFFWYVLFSDTNIFIWKCTFW